MSDTFKIAMCTETGEYHKIKGIKCQDAVGKYENDNCAAIVLCDGAGSVENSDKDSQYVCDTLPEYLTDNFDFLYLLQDDMLVEQILDYLKNNKTKEKLNCTMLATCMNTDGRCLHLHIGDGMIFGRKGTDEYHLVSEAENGSESYITFFLSGETAMQHIRVSREECDEVFMTSDGLTDILYSENKVMNAVLIMTEWLKKYDSSDVEKKYKQEMEEFFSERTSDDISVAVIVRGWENYDRKRDQ